MAAKTKEEIQKEIQELRKVEGLMLDPTSPIPAVTGFGDSNVDKVFAAIWALRMGADEDDVYNRFEDEDWEKSHGQIHSALHAIQWRDDEWDDDLTDEEKQAPSVGWFSFKKS